MFEAAHRARRKDTLVHQIIAETGRVATKQPDHVVWCPATVANPMPAKLCQAGDFPDRCRCTATYHGLNLGLQLRRHPFVGIQRKHPRMSGESQGTVFLRSKTRPVRRDLYPCTKLMRQLDRIVCATRIQHHYFVSERDRSQARLNVGSFVFGDKNDGEIGQNETEGYGRSATTAKSDSQTQTGTGMIIQRRPQKSILAS